MKSLLITELEKVRAGRDLSSFDLVSIDDITQDDISLILDVAQVFKKSGTEKIDLLKGKTIINAFYESSTRTRTSFEIAGKNLSADTINISASGSSLGKGESYIDTTQTLAALQPVMIIMRTSESGLPAFVARHVSPSIVNAGDGLHEHPTQALLDLKTILDHHETLTDKIVTIVGDISHSRVFGSLVRILNRYKATIRVVCPETFFPKDADQFGVRYMPSVDDALVGADVVYALRVQEERGSKSFIPSLREYSKSYGIQAQRFEMANDNAILMHPGPVIRDIDVSSQLVNHQRSRILTQVENGLAIRKAILWLLCDRMDKKVKQFIPA